ncbi:MAG: PRC-barrel domain-containing protein [Paracoccaceae bacterium]
MSSMGPDELRGEWVMGATVTSTEGEAIGSIEDVIIGSGDGTVKAAVVSVGGFLGFGAKQIAVDWEELNIDYDGLDITLDLTREDAEEAPAYEFRDRETPPPPEPEGGTATGGGTGTMPQ